VCFAVFSFLIVSGSLLEASWATGSGSALLGPGPIAFVVSILGSVFSYPQGLADGSHHRGPVRSHGGRSFSLSVRMKYVDAEANGKAGGAADSH